jgi:AcrR family transcriptional regulator
MPPIQEDRSSRLAALSLEALETRNRILEDAERLFRVYGYSKTTVADIAQACRMSPANVYRFFTSKSAINNAICERLIAEDEDALKGIVRLPIPASERIKRLVVELNRRSLQNFIDNKKVHEMVMVALEERWEAIREHIHRVRDVFATVIQDGIDSGEFRQQDVKRAAECSCAAMAPLRHPVMLVQCMDDPEKPTPSEMADFIIQALK